MALLNYSLPEMFTNKVSVPKNYSAGEKTQGDQYGLVNWTVDNTNRSKQYEFDYQREDSTILYSPTTTQYTIPIITISGSEVRDTGNTGYVQPSTFTPSVSQSASATHQDEEKTGVDLTSIIVPVAAIGGVAALAYAAVTLIGGN